MPRPIALVGAPSSIGIRPYDDGTPRRLDLAPSILRGRGLVERLGARDFGDVVPPPYRDFERTAGRVRNEDDVARYSVAVADRVRSAAAGDCFVLVLGGDCSIVLGALLAHRAREMPIGLAYVDGHGDFFTPDSSYTGSAASMCLGFAVGRGNSTLARLDGPAELVHDRHVAVIGRHDHEDDSWQGAEALPKTEILDLSRERIRDRGPSRIAREALERLTSPELSGFWVHLDADVLDSRVMPAVDSPDEDGLELAELRDVLAPLVRHPRALGLQVTIYDPGLDPDGTAAATLADLIAEVLEESPVAVGA